MSGRDGHELADAVVAGAELTEVESLRVVVASKNAQVGRIVARNTDALGFVDQTVYANDDNRDDLRWSNAEVLELLGMIRDKLSTDAIWCDYCGDTLPSVQSRAHIPTTPDIQRLGFSAELVVCPECVSRARAVREPQGEPSDARFRGIVGEVVAEAERSIAKHGEQRHLPMGTGAVTRPLSARDVERGSMHEPGMWPGMSARHLARIATLDTKSHSANEGGDDTCTWWHILREEVFEAAAENRPEALRAELVQVAAVAVKMIDALDSGTTRGVR